MKKLATIVTCTLAISLLVGVLSCGKASPQSSTTTISQAQSTASQTLPAKMMWSTSDVGSAAYISSVALGQALRETTGMTVRVLPSGTGTSRMVALLSGSADIAFVAFEGLFAADGSEEFSTIEWGPQKLLSLMSPVFVNVIATQGDSRVKTIADLKGTKVPFIPGFSSVNVRTDAILSFAGLTWNDVQKVEYPSTNAAFQALIDGKIDWVSFGNTAQSAMVQLESSPRGLRYIQLPHNNEEGWKRMQATMPFVKAVALPGAGVKPGERVESYGVRYPQLATLEGRISTETAYALVKALDEAYEKNIKGVFTGSEAYKFEETLAPPYELPIHPGTVKYAKGKGLWTEKHEAANQAVLERMAKEQKAWDIVMAEVAEKKIKESEFSKYWLQRRAELLRQ